MKIVFISYNYNSQFTHPEVWLKRINMYTGIMESLSKSHTVISIEQINYDGKLFQNGVEYFFFKQRKPSIFFLGKLHGFIRKLQPHVVIVHGLHYPLQVMLLRKQLGGSIKIIAQHHAEKPFAEFKKSIQRLADKFINAYMFTSLEMGEEWIKKGIIADRKKIWGIMEASSVFKQIDKTLARKKTFAEGAPIFLWVGRLDKNKDPLTVVEAFVRYCEVNKAARLYMIFHATQLLHEVQELIKNENCRSVIFVGKVKHNEMSFWFNSADFIISGSHYEGSGVAVCEAMSCGCIPILTNIASFKKLTGEGKCGILYERGNAQDLFNALLKTREINIHEEQKKVLKQFDEELSFNVIAERLDEQLSNLTKTAKTQNAQ